MGNIPSTTIRSAVAADASALARFAGVVFRQTFDETAEVEDIEAYLSEAYGPKIQAAEIADPNAWLFVAEAQSSTNHPKLVGYAHLKLDLESTAELLRIYVGRAWQGRGLAQRLLDEVLSECRRHEVRRVRLSVWHRNARAIAFYQKCGFQICDAAEFPWGDDVEVGFVMERSLS